MVDGIIPKGTEFQVNTETANNQMNVSSGALDGGGYVVTWTSFSQDGSGNNIFAQQYNADGSPKGAEFGVNSLITDTQTTPNVTGLADGGYMIVWASYDQDGDGYGIYAQRYTAAGAKMNGEFRVNDTVVDHQTSPTVTAMDDGGYYVTWDSQTTGADATDVYAKRYFENGTVVLAEHRVNTHTPSGQSDSDTVKLANGGYVVTWQSFGQDGSMGGIYGQVYDSAGIMAGAEFRVNTFTSFHQNVPSVSSLQSGGFVVTWASEGQDGSNSGIIGQMYSANGAAVGSEFLINTSTVSSQFEPSVAGLADGGFVVAWRDWGHDGDSFGVFAQRYDAAGVRVGGEVLINSTTDSEQESPEVTAFEDGGFVINWVSNLQDGSGSGVFGQMFTPQLFGTASNDTISDIVGANWLHGQDGRDVLMGRGGRDKIFGGRGNDKLKGGNDKDALFGGDGKDKLFGGAQADKLKGGDGNDLLDGGNGKDTLTGGDGLDTFVFKAGYGKDRIADFQDDIDTFQLDEDLWGGGRTKQQVINAYAEVIDGDMVFTFGTQTLTLTGFSDLSELRDDMVFI